MAVHLYCYIDTSLSLYIVSDSSPFYPLSSLIFALLLNSPSAILLRMYSYASGMASFRSIILPTVRLSTEPPAENTNDENLPSLPAVAFAVSASPIEISPTISAT